MSLSPNGSATPSPFPFALFFPDRLEALHDTRRDAERLNAALASVMELLQGCKPDHQLTAANLAALLEPLWAGLDTLCGDLRSVEGAGTSFSSISSTN